MSYRCTYKTPSGFSDLVMHSDGVYLTGLWFSDSKDARMRDLPCEEMRLPVFDETARWLDVYFNGGIPDFTPEYRILGATPFRKEVIDLLNTIPYGHTVTYGDLARKLAEKKKLKRMSAQAVGGAVGWNPICMIIPCHMVVGAGENLIGYGGGLLNKAALLRLEGIRF